MLINPGHNQYTCVNKVAEIKFWLKIIVIKTWARQFFIGGATVKGNQH